MHTAMPTSQPSEEKAILAKFLGAGNLDDIIPKLARDREAMRQIEAVAQRRETTHDLIHGDARAASALEANSIHLAVTSPPYWTLKRYNEHDEQLGHVADYDDFIAGLDEVWRNCSHNRLPSGKDVGATVKTVGEH